MRKSRQELLNQASESYRNLQFRDDFLFCKILGNNPEIAKELLELILNVKIRKVVTEPQAAIEITAEGRGIRLDVFVEDEDNTVYDIEMQTTKQSDLGKRSRYYQGMIDLNLMEFFNLLNTGQGSTDLCNRIEKEVIRARNHDEWRSEYMTLYMRDQENIEKGIEKGIMAMIHFCQKMNLGTEQIIQTICEEFHISEEEALKYVKEII